MLARAHSHAVLGMEAYPVEVEAHLGLGLPSFTIVGLPDAAVREAKERVRSGIANSGFEFPLRRITINLAPADTRKEGPSFDLPIALALLAASEQFDARRLDGYTIAGELSLDGSVRPVGGALAIADGARRSGRRGLLLPLANAREAALVAGIDVFGVSSLQEAAGFLAGDAAIAPVRVDTAGLFQQDSAGGPDLAEVKGQENARRALEVCAAGGHNLLMIGPPGSGKTMLAQRLPSILPPLEMREAIEVTRVYSVAGLLGEQRTIITARPFRAPHHTISHAGLVGGGATPRPGEISLSHLGVLFLDELPEYSRSALETLRQPLEDGFISVSRALTSVTFPARFMLVAAMNPCPCGHLGDRRHDCSCPQQKISQYRSRISGPLMDRIDVAVHVPALGRKELLGEAPRERSAIVASRVAIARGRQLARFGADGDRSVAVTGPGPDNRRSGTAPDRPGAGRATYCNAQMSSNSVERWCRLDKAGHSLLAGAIERLGLSARAHHRILRVARTIADLDGDGPIKPAHLAEAISYRSIDRKAWHE